MRKFRQQESCRNYVLCFLQYFVITFVMLSVLCFFAKRQIEQKLARIILEPEQFDNNYGGAAKIDADTIETIHKTLKNVPKARENKYVIQEVVESGIIDWNEIDRQVEESRKNAPKHKKTAKNSKPLIVFDQEVIDSDEEKSLTIIDNITSPINDMNTTIYTIETSTTRAITSTSSIKPLTNFTETDSSEDAPESDTNNRDYKPVNNPSSDLPDHFKRELTEYLTKFNSTTHTNEDYVYFTLINTAYFDLTQNWLCNTENMTNVHESTLIVSFNQSTCSSLYDLWQFAKFTCISLNGHINSSSSMNQPLSWGQKSYVRFLTLRANILHHILVGHSQKLVLFETDAVWMRNPVEYFANFSYYADVVLPVKGYEEKSLTLAFDPMILRPTDAAKELITEMARRLDQDASLFDQDVLDTLCKQQYMGVNCDTFPWEEIGDGLWYKLPSTERSMIHPYIVNNNFISGVDAKITRQAFNAQWFLKVNGRKCDRPRVRKFLKKHRLLVSR